MALKYWHTTKAGTDGHNIAHDIFFRTDDAVISDAAVMALFADNDPITGDDDSFIIPQRCTHLEPATQADYDAWHNATDRIV